MFKLWRIVTRRKGLPYHNPVSRICQKLLFQSREGIPGGQRLRHYRVVTPDGLVLAVSLIRNGYAVVGFPNQASRCQALHWDTARISQVGTSERLLSLAEQRQLVRLLKTGRRGKSGRIEVPPEELVGLTSNHEHGHDHHTHGGHG